MSTKRDSTELARVKTELGEGDIYRQLLTLTWVVKEKGWDMDEKQENCFAAWKREELGQRVFI